MLQLRKRIALSIFTLFVCGSFPAFSVDGKPVVETGEDGTYIVKIVGKDYLGVNAQDDFSLSSSPSHYTNFGNPTDIGFRFWLQVAGDGDTKDMGFGPMQPAQLVTIDYDNTKGADKYVRSVEIVWSNIPQCGGGINLYGRGKNRQPYELKAVNKLEELALDNDVSMQLFPKDAKDGVTKVVFDRDIKYIAMSYARNETIAIARFSSLTITLSDIPPSASVQFGDSGSQDVTCSLPWRNTGITIKDSISFTCESEDFSSDDIEFYITPLFDITGKPDVTAGFPPAGMSEIQWSLYKAMESSGRPYDGYAESAAPIRCSYQDGVLDIPAPCSGKYSLTARSTKYDLDMNKVTLNIWADTSNDYSWLADVDDTIDPSYHYFALNGVNDSHSESGEFLYPFEDASDPSLGAYGKGNVELYIPGVFNGRIFYKWDVPGASGLARTVAADGSDVPEELAGYTELTGDSPLTFDQLSKDNDTGYLEVRVLKNDALTPLISEENGSENQFVVKLTDSVSSPTAILTVEASDANSPVEYYSIDGRLIPRSRLAPGIYIRKKGSESTKVIVR